MEIASETGLNATAPDKPIYSVLSYCNRRPQSQMAGKTRVDETRPVPESTSPFKQDENTIINSPAFPRLRELYQFNPPFFESLPEHYENRESHTIFAQFVGETIGRKLNMDEDSIALIRAILAQHDLRHLPFSHEGESIAHQKLARHGKRWNHDIASLKEITEWANNGQGMNLTADVVEGAVKRYGRYDDTQETSHYNHHTSELPKKILQINATHPLHLDKWNHPEGQIAAIADWVAYTVTDTADGLRSGWLTLKDIREHFPTAEQSYNAIVTTLREGRNAAPDGDAASFAARVSKQNLSERQNVLLEKFCTEIFSTLIDDIVSNTLGNVGKLNIQYADDVRNAPSLTINFSPEMHRHMEGFGKVSQKAFDKMNVVLNPAMQAMSITIDSIANGTYPLPETWEHKRAALMTPEKAAERLELACEYLAREGTEKDVMTFVKEQYPHFWQHHFGTKKTIKHTAIPAYGSTRGNSDETNIRMSTIITACSFTR